MPRYVALINWTDDGRKNFGHTREGYLAAQEALAEFGVHFRDIYWTLGEHDLVGVLDAPDDESAAAAMLCISSPGGIRATATRAFGLGEIDALLQRAHEMGAALRER